VATPRGTRDQGLVDEGIRRGTVIVALCGLDRVVRERGRLGMLAGHCANQRQALEELGDQLGMRIADSIALRERPHDEGLGPRVVVASEPHGGKRPQRQRVGIGLTRGAIERSLHDLLRLVPRAGGFQDVGQGEPHRTREFAGAVADFDDRDRFARPALGLRSMAGALVPHRQAFTDQRPVARRRRSVRRRQRFVEHRPRSIDVVRAMERLCQCK
jgi:hypothetical protein